MASVVRMPSVLADATEAAIANWLVAPGDRVAVGDPMVEIETEKALVEYQAEEPGIVGRLVLAAGDAGEVGAPMAVLIREGETDADIDAALRGGAAAVSRRRRRRCALRLRPRARRRWRRTGRGPAATAGRIFASPLVRKVALEKGIDLGGVTGTGPNGRIVRRDIARLAGRLDGRTEGAELGSDPRHRPAAAAPPARPDAPDRRTARDRCRADGGRQADPAHAGPARDRAPADREQGDHAALLPVDRVRGR